MRLLVLWLLVLWLLVLRLLVLRLLVLWLLVVILVMLIVLMILVMLIVLVRLMGLLLRKERLLLRSIGLAGHLRLVIVLVVAVVVGKIAAHVTAGLLLEKRLGLAKLFLRGGDQAKIMFGVLIIIFAGDRVPGALRITG